MGESTNEWNLERVSGIPSRFCRGGWHHHQLGKGKRAWDRDPYSLIIISICLFLICNLCKVELNKLSDYLTLIMCVSLPAPMSVLWSWVDWMNIFSFVFKILPVFQYFSIVIPSPTDYRVTRCVTWHCHTLAMLSSSEVILVRRFAVQRCYTICELQSKAIIAFVGRTSQNCWRQAPPHRKKKFEEW